MALRVVLATRMVVGKDSSTQDLFDVYISRSGASASPRFAAQYHHILEIMSVCQSFAAHLLPCISLWDNLLK
jgi:hypothetical protein